MPTFEIVEARRWMCGRIARMLRAEHAAACAKIGLDVHRGIRDMYDRSPAFRRAWMIDGQLAAVGGVTGSPLSPGGYIWVALSERATRYPKAFVEEARRQMEEIMVLRLEVHSTILVGDEASMRMSIFLGFRASDDPEGAAAETIHGRRRLREYMKHEVSKLANGQAIMVAYDGPAGVA